MDKEILSLLKACRAKYPNLRFCQLIVLALLALPELWGAENPRQSSFGIFYVSDEALVTALKKYLKAH